MAVVWRRVVWGVCIVGLCFFGIPIRVHKSDELNIEEMFKDFLQKYNKLYATNETEYSRRYNYFKESLKLIEEMNKNRPTNQSALYGVTRYSDLSPEEFAELHLQPSLPMHMNLSRLKGNQNTHAYRPKHVNSIYKRALADHLPSSVDWRKKNVITKVRNQKTCGACWAFSTVETIESMYAIRKGTLQTLSVQELIDCAGYGNLGCEGGDTCSLLEWLIDNKTRIETDGKYPLTWTTQTCKLKGTEQGIQITNFTCQYLVGSEEEILSYLYHHGPVSVAINALNWQNYLGGIIQFHCDASPQHINHAVQIVGYELNTEVPYYIVRNSWGPEFGDDGYLYIAVGENLCGLATEVSTVDVQ
ncbi:cathepsin O-like [Periplaneta americana]|uniref:cathepsin O-like n=1 Tax=Periplaneta americana TaxID=6978 RepID=UPI0037E99B8D